jgi:hypothetical protein
MGTISPRPTVYHVPATETNLLCLADATEGCPDSEIAWHFHVYQPGKVLLHWYDIFALPLYISKDISEEKIITFCTKLGVDYKVREPIKEDDAR